MPCSSSLVSTAQGSFPRSSLCCTTSTATSSMPGGGRTAATSSCSSSCATKRRAHRSTTRLVLGGSSRVQVQARHALRRSSPMLRSSTWIGGFSCSTRMGTRLLLDRLTLLLPSRGWRWINNDLLWRHNMCRMLEQGWRCLGESIYMDSKFDQKSGED